MVLETLSILLYDLAERDSESKALSKILLAPGVNLHISESKTSYANLKSKYKKILDKYINTHQDVLFETCDNNNFYRGYTDNYILVKAQSSENISGKIIKTRILSAHNDFLIGENFI